MAKILKYRVACVLLCHAGVTQPDAWELWLKNAPATVELYVHAPKTFDKPGSFEARFSVNRLGGKKIYMGATAWCGASIVFEHLRAVRKVVDNVKGDEPLMVYMLSGADLPVKPPAAWLGYEYMSTVFLPKYARDIPDSSHPQWMALRVDHAQVLVDAYITADFKATALFDEHVLRTTCKRALTAYRCPDNFLIGLALIRSVNNALRADALRANQPLDNSHWDNVFREVAKTNAHRAISWDLREASFGGLRSPLEWTSVDQRSSIRTSLFDAADMALLEAHYKVTKERTQGEKDGYIPNISICPLLCAARLSKNAVVFRKVTQSLVLDKAFLTALYNKPDDTITMMFGTLAKRDHTQQPGQVNNYGVVDAQQRSQLASLSASNTPLLSAMCSGNNMDHASLQRWFGKARWNTGNLRNMLKQQDVDVPENDRGDMVSPFNPLLPESPLIRSLANLKEPHASPASSPRSAGGRRKKAK